MLSACFVVNYLGLGLFAAVSGFATVIGLICLLLALSASSHLPRRI